MTRRLRIAFVVHDYHRQGGQARYVAELAHRFRGEHDVHVFSNTFIESDAIGIQHHPVAAWRANALTTILSFIVTSTWAVDRSYDIVHAQGLCGLRQNIITAHMCQAGWFHAIQQLGIPQSWRKRLFGRLTTRLERLAYRRGSAKAYIAVSQKAADDLRHYYNVRYDVKVIHHGVDIQTFNPQLRLHLRTPERAAAGIPDDATLGLYVGDWQKSGNPLLQLLQKQPAIWLMAVTGSPHEAIRRAAIEHNVQDRLILHAPSDRIERAYAAADIFLFPSFYDTFGMVTSEAMACGLPVIVSAAAGVSEWIIDGRNGIILRSPWDAEELSAAVSQLLATPALPHQFGQKARETVETHPWDRVAEETMKVYQHVVTRNEN